MGMMRCPFCAEEIQAEAKKCRFCGEWLEEPDDDDTKPVPGAPDRVDIAKGIASAPRPVDKAPRVNTLPRVESAFARVGIIGLHAATEQEILAYLEEERRGDAIRALRDAVPGLSARAAREAITAVRAAHGQAALPLENILGTGLTRRRRLIVIGVVALLGFTFLASALWPRGETPEALNAVMVPTPEATEEGTPEPAPVLTGEAPPGNSVSGNAVTGTNSVGGNAVTGVNSASGNAVTGSNSASGNAVTGGNAITPPNVTPAPQPGGGTNANPEAALALADSNGTPTAPDDQAILPYRLLIDDLRGKYSEDRQQIIDLTLKAHGELKTAGVLDSARDIMNALNQIYPRKLHILRYGDFANQYVAERKTGNSVNEVVQHLQLTVKTAER